jgi:hypothetical protein
MLFVGAGLMGTFYLLALYLQQVLGFSPLWAGVASLPFSAGIILGAGISSKLVERLALRLVAGPGLLLGVLGMFQTPGVMRMPGHHSRKASGRARSTTTGRARRAPRPRTERASARGS